MKSELRPNAIESTEERLIEKADRIPDRLQTIKYDLSTIHSHLFGAVPTPIAQGNAEQAKRPPENITCNVERIHEILDGIQSDIAGILRRL